MMFLKDLKVISGVQWVSEFKYFEKYQNYTAKNLLHLSHEWAEGVAIKVAKIGTHTELDF